MRDYSQYAMATPPKKQNCTGNYRGSYSTRHDTSSDISAQNNITKDSNGETKAIDPTSAPSSLASAPPGLSFSNGGGINNSRNNSQYYRSRHAPLVSSMAKEDGASVGTAVTQSSNDHSPPSNASARLEKGHESRPLHLQQPSGANDQGVNANPATSKSSATRIIPAMKRRGLSSLTPADALSLKRDGPEATILNLRRCLGAAQINNDASGSIHKFQREKADATILELRSSVRQLKRQLEKLDGENREKHAELVEAKKLWHSLKRQQLPDDASASARSQHTTQTTQEQEKEHAMAKEERVGELQVQLDRAHAQILTADMVRKELEDTLEAEQYTWELRVQDQERTIADLQQEIGVLTEDLVRCQQEWKQADGEWANQVAGLEYQLQNVKEQHQGPRDAGSGNSDKIDDDSKAEIQNLQVKLRELEGERNELQTCLDEALLELEAVDAELGSHTPTEVQQLRKDNQRLQEAIQKQRVLQQQAQLQQGDADFDTLEKLQYLYRWLLERAAVASSTEGEEKKSDILPQTSPELLDYIHHLLEKMLNLNANVNLNADSDLNKSNLAQQVVALQSQLSLYRDDLEAKEQSSAELRASLKEAVALIKPLQDSVDKADQQNADLRQEIGRMKLDHDLEIRDLQQDFRTAEDALCRKEQECEGFQHDIHCLQLEVRDAKELGLARQTMQELSPMAAAAAAAAAHTPPPADKPQELSSLGKARSDLRAKRAQEQTLRSLLQDAQKRFHTLNEQNESVSAKNEQLQGRLRNSQDQRGSRSSGNSVDDGLGVDVMSQPSRVSPPEQLVSTMKRTLQDRNKEIEELRRQVQDYQHSPEVFKRIQESESQLAVVKDELEQKRQSEKALNKSLKEALVLLKPLKSHLEEAESEKKELTIEVRTLRQKLSQMEIKVMDSVAASHDNIHLRSKNHDGAGTHVASSIDDQVKPAKEDLEDTVRHLEQENSQLHDALDEMSRVKNMSAGVDTTRSLSLLPSSPNENRHASVDGMSNGHEGEAGPCTNEEIEKLRSHCKVTDSRWEDAHAENNALSEALREREESEKEALESMRLLRERLRKTEMDLENAKYIATSALVKVENTRNVDHISSMERAAFESEAHTGYSLEEKAIELDLLVAAGMFNRSPPMQQQQQHRSLKQHEHTLGSSGQSLNDCNNPLNSWPGKQSRLADF